MWPRGSAGADRFWAGDNLSNEAFYRAKSRLQAFRCHMVSRGIRAEPLGPGGFCPLGEIHRFDYIDPAMGEWKELTAVRKQKKKEEIRRAQKSRSNDV